VKLHLEQLLRIRFLEVVGAVEDEGVKLKPRGRDEIRAAACATGLGPPRARDSLPQTQRVAVKYRLHFVGDAGAVATAEDLVECYKKDVGEEGRIIQKRRGGRGGGSTRRRPDVGFLSNTCSECYKNAVADENVTEMQWGKGGTYEEEVVCVVARGDAGHPAPVPALIVTKMQ
jgi:hypothetical protein